jgi:hypothetical protein
VHVEDLDISPSKIADKAPRIIQGEESRRREPLVTSEHPFLVFSRVEWDGFAEVMRDVDHTILHATEEYPHMVPIICGARAACLFGDAKSAHLPSTSETRTGTLSVKGRTIAGDKDAVLEAMRERHGFLLKVMVIGALTAVITAVVTNF